MTSREQYVKAIGVLTQVGGTWHGVGDETDPYLLVNVAQYQALVDAGVVAVEKNGKDPKRGKRSGKRTKS
jgi:hypothetical protein